MNHDLFRRVLASPRLPSLPAVALEVIDLVQQPNVSLREIAQTVQNDPALAARVLKTVNSSFYGQCQTVSTITHALVVLGLNSVKTLALGFSLVGNLRGAGGTGFDHMAYWKRSLYTATAARRLSARIGMVQQEEAFLGGLMQDIGVLALYQVVGEAYAGTVAAAAGAHGRLRHLEQETLGLDHTTIGGALAESWRLPPLLVSLIRYHEEPEDAEEDVALLARCVAAGNRVADVFTSDEPGEALASCHETLKRWFGLTEEEAEPVLRQVHTDAAETRRLFDLPTGELGNPDEILARANEALLHISLQSQIQSSRLQQQNRELTEQALTDPLTGLANRRRFNEFIDTAFAAARASGDPLSVLFLDADHFKRLNDTLGHTTGDRALASLARLLMDIMPEGSLVARYGGEEFAVVLPHADRRTAARLAEYARQRLAAIPVQADSGPTRLTVSIGVATLEGEVFDRAEQLVTAADQGVYAAKAAGRNCVRIFIPRTEQANSTAA